MYFTLWMFPALDARVRRPIYTSLLREPLVKHSTRKKIRKYRFPRKRECSSPEPPEQVQSEAVLRFAPMTQVGGGLFGINLQQSTSAADTEKQQWRSVPSSLTPKPLLEGWQRTKNSFSVSLIPDRKHTKKGFLRRMLWVPNKTTQNEKKGKRLSLNGISVINRYLF